ncbi:MAG: hypothetical protein HQM08_14845 [Candidatus Riflebacteria bacterium]|nr:hypothetical protein [Candidatus Riflebacteria bacterium]
MKRKKKGGISYNLLAIVLLTFSITLLIASYKSLRRSFSGIVIQKSQNTGIFPDCWLILCSEPEEYFSSISFRGKTNYSGKMVGISSIAFEDCRYGSRISKESFSPFLVVDEVKYLDLGVTWGFFSLAGIIASFLIYFQKFQKKADDEEISSDFLGDD